MDEIAEAIAKAKEMAQKLRNSSNLATELGKRKNRWEDDSAGPAAPTTMASFHRKKIYLPKETSDINYLGLLIGPKGVTQKQLQESTGAKIIIRGRGAHRETSNTTAPHPDDDDDIHVALEGPYDSVEKAAAKVEEILNNPDEALRLKQEQLRNMGGDNGTSMMSSSENQIELLVPNHLVGLLIGKGGENIQKLQFQTGAHMQITKESEMKPGETKRSIFLKGTPSAIADLKQKVEEIILARSGGTVGGSATTASSNIPKLTAPTPDLRTAVVLKVAVPNDKVGIIIGKGGMTIKNIQDKSRTTIYIPPAADEDNPMNRTLSIGADSKEDAEAAQMEILMAMQQYQQNAMMSGHAPPMPIVVPDDKVGIIIGKGGVVIKDIQARNRVKVVIPQQADYGSNPPVRTCSIIGPYEGQEASRYEIEMILMGQGHIVGQTAYCQPGAASAMPASYGMNMYGSYGSGYDMYGAAAAAAAAAAQGYYGASTGYDAAAAAAAAASMGYGVSTATVASPANASAATASTAVPTDPTAYYNDFWLYAQYYGEAVARTYYGGWAPPVGTPPPAGIVLPTQDGSTAASSSNSSSLSSSNYDMNNSGDVGYGESTLTGSTTTTSASDASYYANATSESAMISSNSTSESTINHSSSNTINNNDNNDSAYDAFAAAIDFTSSSSSEAMTDPTMSTSSASIQSQSSNESALTSSTVAETSSSSSSSAAATAVDPAWDAYRKQYAEWYEAYGKYTGAPEEPPRG